MNVKNETWKHIHEVRKNLHKVIDELLIRAIDHDQCKLYSPEAEAFDAVVPKLKGLTYGSPEYKECLAGMRPAIEHHNNHSRHHPEHHADGMHHMSLIDLLEMMCDWKAATLRHEDGCIYKSLEINAKRFHMSTQLVEILKNTAHFFENPRLWTQELFEPGK